MEINVGMLISGSLLGGTVLFAWSGVTQNLPWGFRAVGKVDSAPELADRVRRQTGDGMFFTTDGVSSLVVVRPQNYYNPARYFGLEFLTQVAVALVLTAVLSLISPLGGGQKLAVIGLVGLVTALAVDFQYWNWWGFSSRYSLGMASNRLLGWLLAAWALERLVV
ncbi:MAG: hypothetical protein SFU83_24540 [Meiothermus sp.]|nr:hypothetical protein [Meiothermus sp.]